jgi:urea carboxylase-associated protein 2
MSSISTASPLGARDHARAQGGTVVDTMPTVPAAGAEGWPADVAPADRLHAETVAGGNYTTVVLERGAVIELTDLAGDACAHLVLTNAVQVDERLNVADTVKIQWQAYLGAGAMLLSDRGRVLATIVEDTSGRHDTFCGTSSKAANEARYGDGSPQGGTPAGRELLVLAALKNGLEPRDVPPSVSFFQGVRIGADGTTEFTGSAGAGARVRLRLELPCVVLLANVPHPVDPRPSYVSTALQVRAWRGAPADLDAPEATVGPEAGRAFANTIDYARARGL